VDRFNYFTVRVRVVAPADVVQPVSGILEDLTTGQKHSFESADELLRIVEMLGSGTRSASARSANDVTDR
jgi:hypothetical protein